MTVPTSALLDIFAAQPELWPGNLAGGPEPEILASLEAALDGVPPDVLSELLAALGSEERNVWARTAVAALQLVRALGHEPESVAAPGLLQMRDAEGRPWALGILGFQGEEHPGGAPADLKRLTDALDQTFGDRQYVLYLRRAVPPGFDPAPIARAAHLWLGAIDRGEWQGQHAIYEDSEVALELALTGERVRDRRNRVFTVGPITALERLAGVDAELVREAMAFQEVLGDLPLLCVLGADQRWRLPRGYVEQLLYGTANFVCAGSDPAAYEAGFSANGRSLFNDPACRNLVGLCWVEPEPSPVHFRAWAYENPWTAHPDRVPVLSCPRFAVLRRDEVGARQRESVVLGWMNRDAPPAPEPPPEADPS